MTTRFHKLTILSRRKLVSHSSPFIIHFLVITHITYQLEVQSEEIVLNQHKYFQKSTYYRLNTKFLVATAEHITYSTTKTHNLLLYFYAPKDQDITL